MKSLRRMIDIVKWVKENPTATAFRLVMYEERVQRQVKQIEDLQSKVG